MDSLVRLRQIHKPDVSGYVVEILNQYLSGFGITVGNTGTLTGAFYPLRQNPSGYLTSASGVVFSSQTGDFLTSADLIDYIGQVILQTDSLYSRVKVTGSSTITGANFTGVGTVSIYFQNGTIFVSGIASGSVGTATGNYYPSTGNPSGYLTRAAADLVVFQTGSQNISGNKQFYGNTTFYNVLNVPGISNSSNNSIDVNLAEISDSFSVLSIDWGNRTLRDTAGITAIDWDDYSMNGFWVFPSGLTISGQYPVTGTVIRPSDTGQFYPRVGNPSQFITPSQTGVFYPRTNPSGYIQNNSTGSVGFYGVTTIYGPSGALNVNGLTRTLFSCWEPTYGVYYLQNFGGTAFINIGTNGPIGGITTPVISGFGIYTTGLIHAGSINTTGKTLTGHWTISGFGFVTSNMTGSFGAGSTGSLTGAFYPLTQNPSGYLTAAQTGTLVPTGLTGRFITTGQTGTFADRTYVDNASGVLRTDLNTTGYFLLGLIQNFSAVTSLNNRSGTMLLSGTGSVTVINSGQTLYVSGNTGAYANFVYKGETGTFVTSDKTGSFVTTSMTGILVPTGATGNFVTRGMTGVLADANLVVNNYATQNVSGNKSFYGFATFFGGLQVYNGAYSDIVYSISDTSRWIDLFAAQVATGNLVTLDWGNRILSGHWTLSGNGLVTSNQTGTLVPTGLTGRFYLNSNPSGFVTSAQTGILVPTGATGLFVTTNQTGTLVPTGLTGRFYLNTNPSGFVTADQTGLLLSGFVEVVEKNQVFIPGLMFCGNQADTHPVWGGYYTNALTNWTRRGGVVNVLTSGLVNCINASGLYIPSKASDQNALEFATINRSGTGVVVFEFSGISLGVPSHAAWSAFLIARSSIYSDAMTGVKAEFLDNSGSWLTMQSGVPSFTGGIWASAITGIVNYPVKGFKLSLLIASGATPFYLSEVGVWNGNYLKGTNLLAFKHDSGDFTAVTVNGVPAVLTSQTGEYADKNYVTGASGVLRTDLNATGQYLLGLIASSSAGVSLLNGGSGAMIISGTGNVVVTRSGQNIYVSGNTGAYSNFVYKGETGSFVTTAMTGILVPTGATGNFVTNNQTGSFLTTQTGQLRYHNLGSSSYALGSLLSGGFWHRVAYSNIGNAARFSSYLTIGGEGGLATPVSRTFYISKDWTTLGKISLLHQTYTAQITGIRMVYDTGIQQAFIDVYAPTNVTGAGSLDFRVYAQMDDAMYSGFGLTATGFTPLTGVSGLKQNEIILATMDLGGNVTQAIQNDNSAPFYSVNNLGVRTYAFNSYANSGTAPLAVVSKTMVTNLNAEMVGGLGAGDFARYTGTVLLTGNQTVRGQKTFVNDLYISGGASLFTDSVVSPNNTLTFIDVFEAGLIGNGEQTVDWAAKNLFTAGGVSLDWSNKILSGTWTGQVFAFTNETTISNGQLSNGGTGYLNWVSRFLYTTGGLPSVSWGTRELHNNATLVTLNWETKSLIGGWSADSLAVSGSQVMVQSGWQIFTTGIPTGVDNVFIKFPSGNFASVPKISVTLEVTGDVLYTIGIRGRTISGYTALFSDTIQESGVMIHTFASVN